MNTVSIMCKLVYNRGYFLYMVVTHMANPVNKKMDLACMMLEDVNNIVFYR